MGAVKRHLEEVQARGCSDTDGMVCSICITEPALVQVIRTEGAATECSYCGSIPEAPNATVELERIVQLVTDGLQSEYEDPAEGAGWDGREGGYQVPTFDTPDLLWDHEVTENDKLLFDIARTIELELWCQKDPYAATEAEALLWGWEAFRKYVQHRRRYTFLTKDDSTAAGAGYIPMHGIPAAVVRAVAETNMITVFKSGTTWWRARVHNEGENYGAAKDIGTPPDDYARDNRMSPKGIGAFYGASTLVGARAEVAGYASPSAEATIGEFTQLSDLALVDLRDLPRVPSLFDEGRRHLRGMLSFLRDFIADVTKVSDPSDEANLEYIPTQIIAEHLHFDLPADGICWRSTKDRDVTVCVLFLPNASMSDAGATTPDSRMELDAASVRHLPSPL
ncbi:HEPN-associated N-terminal domain-containing protein [Tessaracoccus sp. Z1128]